MPTTLPPVPPAPQASSGAARKVMQGNRATDTRPEVALRRALHALGLRFFKHRRPLADLRARADVVFPVRRVAVFVDGCFWHSCPDHGHVPDTHSAYWSAKLVRNVARDRHADQALADAGWVVVRVWEHEPPEDASRRVAEVVLSQSGHR